MNTPAQTEQVLVVCDRGGDHAVAVEGYLQTQRQKGAVWYAPRDVSDLDRVARAGQPRRVVFPRAEAFLEALWDGSLTASCWLAAGMRVEIAAPAEKWTPEQMATLLACWDRVRRQQRRTQAIAGLLLSAAAIAAAFTLLALAR